MKKTLRILISLVLSLVILSAGAVTVLADGEITQSLSISSSCTPRSDLSHQYFTVTNPNSVAVDVAWAASNGLSGTINGLTGSTTLKVADADLNGVAVSVEIVGVSGKGAMCFSYNGYKVKVVYKNQANDAVLYETEIEAKEGKTISHKAPDTYNGFTRVGSATVGRNYRPITNAELVVYYKEVVPEAYTISAMFVDSTGLTLGYGSLVNVPVGGSVTITPDTDTLTVNGQKYELDTTKGTSYTHTYDMGKSVVYKFVYNAVADNPDRAYDIFIKYVDVATSKTIFTDSATVPIDGQVTYTVKNEYTNGNGIKYVKAANQATTITHKANQINQKNYTIDMVLDSEPEGPYTIEIRFVDTYTGVKIKSETVNVPFNGTGRYDIPSSFAIGGKTYNVVSGKVRSIAHAFNNPQRVYLVSCYDSAGQAPQARTVYVHYLTNDTNQEIRTAIPYTLYPDDINIGITIATTLTYNGVEYTLTSGGGDKQTIVLSYSDERSDYYVYFKYVGVTEEDNTPEPEPEVIPPDDTPVGPDAAAIFANLVRPDFPDDDGQGEIINPDIQPVGPDGNGGSGEVIGDDETPTAPESPANPSPLPWIAAAVAVLGLAIVTVVIVRKRPTGED